MDKIRVHTQSQGSLRNQSRKLFTVSGPSGECRVYRKTYHDIDVRQKSNRQYSQSAIAKRISRNAEVRAGPAPSAAGVRLAACQILARNKGKLPGGAGPDEWQKLLHRAQQEVYIHRHIAASHLEPAEKIEEKAQSPACGAIAQEIVDLVDKNLPTRKPNAFHQSILDEEASKECEKIKGFDIVILRDKYHELICGVVTMAIQKLLPPETVEKMNTAAEAFAWPFPYKRPDRLRHPTNQALHLKANPNKHVHSKECEQPHFAVCGVEHCGLHHELGHSGSFGDPTSKTSPQFTTRD
jgi:hypothetical protein